MLISAMKLLHFAHSGEAQAFISGLQLAPLSQGLLPLYCNESYLLLVTGEGIYASLEKMSAVLAKYPEVQEVINFGICGILDAKRAKLDQIYSIKSVYCYGGHGPEFHSFHSGGELDIVTSSERVTSINIAEKLKPLAPLVDRELWAIARAAKLAGVSFRSYKLTSDFAGNTDCLDIKHRALEFSQKLFEYFQKEQIATTETQIPSHTNLEEKFELYCTHQQKIMLNKLLHALSLKYQCTPEEVLKKADIQKIKNLDISDKQRTHILLDDLQVMLNPLRKEVGQKLQNFSDPLTAIGAQISFDPSLEKKEFTLQMKINHQTNIHKLQQALSELNFDEFSSIMEGQWHD